MPARKSVIAADMAMTHPILLNGCALLARWTLFVFPSYLIIKVVIALYVCLGLPPKELMHVG